MVEAATSYRKNGFNDEDSAQLAKISAMFQNVADEQISAGDAADFLISQLIAFNGTGPQSVENAEHIVDAVNAVSNAYSVSSGDLAQALSIVASSSSAMGNSFEETLAVVTAITEQTRSASKAARGANTIFANLAQVLDENSSNGKKILDIYKNLGLTMFDTNGQLKSGYDLLSELSEKWPGLDTNTQKYIATTLAGEFRPFKVN
nr:MAG TPA: minor tail protein [Caudoviricetes sp.]